ncbi:MAG: dihydrofolate reductase [Bacteroidetes bacterium]|nr:dihydrofolate reductase [Bacteroidota bacterium]MBS1608112.1 dihydrofolate reductase [Bacteroidota bacterium]
MNISLVVAAADNNAIGKENKLLWCLPNDMRFFKNITWGMVVIMGRKTLESLGKPLKGRRNIVITRQKNFNTDGVVVAKDLEKALSAAKEMDVKEVCVIGGGEIYKQFLPVANKIYITRVHFSPGDADTYFPDFSENEWELVSRKDYDADAKHAYPYSFQTWERNRPR